MIFFTIKLSNNQLNLGEIHVVQTKYEHALRFIHDAQYDHRYLRTSEWQKR